MISMAEKIWPKDLLGKICTVIIWVATVIAGIWFLTNEQVTFIQWLTVSLFIFVSVTLTRIVIGVIKEINKP